jgi:predicted RNase H-related nuclease YkuK (DUF458 family)
MKNKLSIILVLALFIMSVVPSTFAEHISDDTKTATGSDSSNVATEDSEDIAGVTTAEPTGVVPRQRRIATAKKVISSKPQITGAKKQVTAIESRLKKCVNFLKSNTGVKEPLAVCKRILNKEKRCVELLKENNVEHPLKICDSIIIRATSVAKDRPYLAKTLTQKAANWKLKKIDKIIDKKPMAKELIKKLPQDKAKILLNLPRAKQKEILGLSEKDALKKLGKYKLKKVSKENLFRKRVIALDRIRNAEANYQVAKKRFVEEKNEYIKAKGLFESDKKALGLCREDDTSEKCVELRNRISKHAKKFLEHSANVLINQLTKLKEKINANDDISEENAAKIIEDIDNAIEKLENEVAKLDAAETKEEIKEIAKTVSSIWKGYKHRIKLYAARLINLKVKDIIERSEQLEKKLDCTLTAMEEQGIEVTAIDAKVDLFSMRIDEGREKYDMAKDLLDKAKDLKTDNPDENEIRTVKALVNQAHKLIRESHAALKEAHQLLRQIIMDIKEAGGTISECTEQDEDLEEDEEYEVVEESEEVDEEEEELEEDEEEVEEEEIEEEEETETIEEEVEEETETTEEEEVEEVDLSVIEKPDCWADKPDYKPGVDKGYFVWQGKCSNFWWVDWSGDTRALWKRWRHIRDGTSEDPSIEEVEEVDESIESGEVTTESDELVEDDGSEVVAEDCSAIVCTEEMPVCEDGEVLIKKQKSGQCCPTYRCVKKPKLLYKVRGKITSNGRIFDVGARRFDGFDKLWVKNNVIHFRARVGPHFDGLFFRTTGDVVAFDLKWDGHRITDLVYIGKDKENPDSIPFKLEGKPAKKPRVCKPGQIIYNKRCVKTIKNRIFKAADVMTTAEAESTDSGFVAEYTEE